MLFVELALIRWTGSNILYLSYFSNFILLANPLSYIESDGHMALVDGGGGSFDASQVQTNLSQSSSSGGGGHKDCGLFGWGCTTVGHQVGEFLGGVGDGSKELWKGGVALGGLVVDCSAAGQIVDPGGCGHKVMAIGSYVWNHPGDFVGSLVDYKDFKSGNYARWAGHLAPTIALTLATMGGGGVIAKGGEAAGLAVEGAEATADVTAGAAAASAGEAGISTAEAGVGDVAATASEASANVGAAAEKVAAEGADGAAPSLFEPGPYAAGSVRSAGPGSVSAAEQRGVNALGEEFGCHTCGAREPGTQTGNWVGDHQPVSRFTRPGQSQELYPQCLTCSRQQGLDVINALRQGWDPYAYLYGDEP
jgi:hypothetical protein